MHSWLPRKTNYSRSNYLLGGLIAQPIDINQLNPILGKRNVEFTYEGEDNGGEWRRQEGMGETCDFGNQRLLENRMFLGAVGRP